MSLADFFTPVRVQELIPENGLYSTQLGTLFTVYQDEFPDLTEKKPDIAVFGVMDDRRSIDNQGCALAPDVVRQQLYRLHHGDYPVSIADLGNIRGGETVKDTYAAVKVAVAELIKQGIVPVIIGGGQDITYAQYLAYENLEQKVDLLVIDRQFDIEEDNEADGTTTSLSYLNKIMVHQPNYLFNFSNVGYQT